MDSRGAQHDEAVYVLLAHTLKNVGDGVGKHVRLFSGTRP